MPVHIRSRANHGSVELHFRECCSMRDLLIGLLGLKTTALLKLNIGNFRTEYREQETSIEK